MSRATPLVKRSGPRPLAELVLPHLKKTFTRQGFSATDLILHWEEIAGSDTACRCEPLKMLWPQPEGPATLTLRVEAAHALDIQYESASIIERINVYFGWKAVSRITLRQAPLKRLRPRGTLPVPPSDQECETIRQNIGTYQRPELLDALARLGAALAKSHSQVKHHHGK